MTNLVTGVFETRAAAEQAIADLKAVGYGPEDINVMMSDEKRARDIATDTGSSVAEDAGVGAGIGGALGAIIAAATATGSMAVIAGTGGVAAPLVAGPIVALLTGAGAGGIVGGLVGMLVGAGIPEEEARHYEHFLNEGDILIAVYPKLGSDQAEQILRRDGAVDIAKQVHAA